MNVTFWGAARTVTGSMHLVECGGQRVLLDCGMYQGRRKEAFERNRNLPFDPRTVNAVVLSHAHIDHSGNLPSLVKGGFRGTIFATSASRDLSAVMLLDSAKIQEQDIEYVNKRRNRNGETPFEPLYTVHDATQTLRQFRTVEFDDWFDVVRGVRCRFHLAGHMLGAASVELELTPEKGDRHRAETAGEASGDFAARSQSPFSKPVKLLFSGDIGRPSMPILPDPKTVSGADYVIMEATYGNRLHEAGGDAMRMLREIVTKTWKQNGRLIVPAFSVGRTQEVVYRLNLLAESGELPPIKVFVDSPLAVSASEVFRAHPECFDEDMVQQILSESDRDPLRFDNLFYIRKVEHSKALNSLQEPCVIISASGMCEAGRVLHHLKNSISDPRNTVLFTGFQAPHTLGRRILDGSPTARIFGEEFPVRATIAKLESSSGHADQAELLAWAEAANAEKTVRQFALVHSEMEASFPLKQLMLERGLPNVTIPDRGDRMAM